MTRLYQSGYFGPNSLPTHEDKIAPRHTRTSVTRWIHILALLLALVLCTLSTGAHAQANGDDDETSEPGPEPEEEEDFDDDGTDTVDPGLLPTPSTNATTAAQILQDARRFCAAVPDPAYQIDCLSERLQAAAESLRGDPELEPARQALLQAAADLQRTVAKYREPAKPPIRASRGGAKPIRTSRPIVPVREQDLATAKAEALNILEETETVLLRAADRSSERALSFQTIAAAVGSNKVLLRS